MASSCGYPSLGMPAAKHSPNQQILKQGQRKWKKINSVEIFMEATWIEIWQLRTCLDARQLRKGQSPWSNRAWGAREQRRRRSVQSHSISKDWEMELCFSERSMAKVSPCLLWRNLPCLFMRIPPFLLMTLSTVAESASRWGLCLQVSHLLVVSTTSPLGFMLLNYHLPIQTVSN